MRDYCLFCYLKIFFGLVLIRNEVIIILYNLLSQFFQSLLQAIYATGKLDLHFFCLVVLNLVKQSCHEEFVVKVVKVLVDLFSVHFEIFKGQLREISVVELELLMVVPLLLDPVLLLFQLNVMLI